MCPFSLDHIKMEIRLIKVPVIFVGENFHKFHESSSIRENFTLEMYIFSWYSNQSVTFRENFTLEKLKSTIREIFPLENNPLYGISNV